jgi:hypothetical protein
VVDAAAAVQGIVVGDTAGRAIATAQRVVAGVTVHQVLAAGAGAAEIARAALERIVAGATADGVAARSSLEPVVAVAAADVVVPRATVQVVSCRAASQGVAAVTTGRGRERHRAPAQDRRTVGPVAQVERVRSRRRAGRGAASDGATSGPVGVGDRVRVPEDDVAAVRVHGERVDLACRIRAAAGRARDVGRGEDGDGPAHAHAAGRCGRGGDQPDCQGKGDRDRETHGGH